MSVRFTQGARRVASISVAFLLAFAATSKFMHGYDERFVVPEFLYYRSAVLEVGILALLMIRRLQTVGLMCAGALALVGLLHYWASDHESCGCVGRHFLSSPSSAALLTGMLGFLSAVGVCARHRASSGRDG